MSSNPQNLCKKLQNQKKQKTNEKESSTGTQEGVKQVFKETAGYMITFQKKVKNPPTHKKLKK